MVLYLYKEKAEEGELSPNPRLLYVSENQSGEVSFEGHEFCIFYEL